MKKILLLAFAFFNLNSFSQTFTNINAAITGVSSGECTWGDYDNDGDLDILVTGFDNSMTPISKVYMNGNGTFTDINAGLMPLWESSAAWGDYDNDGDLDILLAGKNGSMAFTFIYRNNGNQTFTDLGLTLPGVCKSATVWGDYDSDGDLDFLLAGESSTTNTSISKIFRNDGNSTFTDINAPLTGLRNVSAAWSDYDNDGDLDLAIAGAYGSPNTYYEASLFRNNNGSFSWAPGTNLGDVANSAMAWGDYDSDGDQDLVVSGSYTSGSYTYYSTTLYNNNNNVLSPSSVTFPGQANGGAAWGDIDNNGYLDLILTGYGSTAGSQTVIYLNTNGSLTPLTTSIPTFNNSSVSLGDYNNDGDLDIIICGTSSAYLTQIYSTSGVPLNTSPSALTGLTATVSGNDIIFSWNAGTDTQTPATGLTYNLRVGTAPGGTQKRSPHAAASTGLRTIAEPGNINGTSWTLKGVSAGTYYWSVQAIDHGHRGGSFAAEATVISNSPPAPVLTSPANGAINVPIPTILQWQSSANATSYEVEVSTNSTFTNIVYTQSSVTDTFITVPALAQYTNHFWRVKAIGVSAQSNWSSQWFKTGALTDAGLVKFVYPTICPGTNNVAVWVKNYGIQVLTSFTINWSVSSFPKPAFNWTGNLNPGDSIAVVIGNHYFIPNNGANVSATVVNPNNSIDPVSSNNNILTGYSTTSMSGVYTIGGTTPNFTTFTAAINQLVSKGVCGPVIFNVRNGTYPESITLANINGVSNINTITFKSESGDSTMVILKEPVTSSTNYVLGLNTGAKYFRFEKITIKTQSNLFVPISIIGNTKAITFKGSIIQGFTTTSTSNSYAILSQTVNGRADSLTFEDNEFRNGSSAILLSGTASVPCKGIIIKNNKFIGNRYQAISLQAHEGALITGNTITSTVSSFIYGIKLNSCSSGMITEKNVINITFGTGIYLVACSASVANEGITRNNMITISNARGIHVHNSTNQGFYFNSINVPGTSPYATAFYVDWGSGTKCLNNIFSNEGPGYAYWISNPSIISQSNHNDIYSAGTYIGYTGANQATLTDWIMATGKDSSSVSISPGFVSSSDLHITNNITLYGAGIPVPGILSDIDDDSRNASTPCIGADEYFPILNDASVLSSSLSNTICQGNIPVSITLKNTGMNPLTSVTIDWSVNGIPQTPVNWTGNLATSNTTSVTLGSINAQGGNSYSIFFATSNPNSANDDDPSNDTLTVNAAINLSGTYTIGGSMPDFATLTSAVNSLTQYGICGPVVFDIRNGVYPEPIMLLPVTGASAVNTITFQSEALDSTAVIIKSSNLNDPNPVIRLNGADHITFRNLTLKNECFTSNMAVKLFNGATNITLSNNKLTGISYITPATAATPYLIYSEDNSSTNTNNNITITFNNFEYGAWGAYLKGFSPSSGNNISNGVNISNNVFNFQEQGGVYIRRYNNVTAEGNNIHSLAAGYSGMSIQSCNSDVNVNRNRVIAPSGAVGIQLVDCQATSAGIASVANNFIMINGTSNAKGIYSDGSIYARYSFNTVRLGNTNTSSAAMYIYNGSSIEVLNNNLVNTGGGYAYYNSSSPAVTISNYNNLYSSGSNLAYWGANASTLSAFQTLSNKDLNSVSTLPMFTAPANYQHSTTALNDAGTPVTGISTDIAGNARNAANPDIGASEFTPHPLDIGVSRISGSGLGCQGSNPFVVNVTNYGTSIITSFDINYVVNDTLQPAYSWTGSLNPGDSVTGINVGTFTFSTPGKVKAWTSSPNAMQDNDATNDTSYYSNSTDPLNGTYTIGGANPDFPTFGAAVSALVSRGICGAVTFNARPGLYFEQVTIPAISGVSGTNNITFRSSTGNRSDVKLSYFTGSSIPSVMHLNGASHITISDITIEMILNDVAFPQAEGITMQMTNATNINLFNNEIVRPSLNGTSPNYSAIYCSGGNQFHFKDNLIHYGSYGIYWSTGSSSAPDSVIAENNELHNQFYMGIAASGIYYTKIISNIIDLPNINSFTGIHVTTCQVMDVSKNKVTGLPQRHLHLGAITATAAEPATVTNNFFTGAASLIGCDYVSLLNNNFSTSTLSSLVSLQNSGNIRILNNNLANFGTSSNHRLIGIPPNYSISQISACDYNNLYSVSGISSAPNTLTLQQWRDSTGFDMNSVSVNPNYTSTSDLHVSSPYLNNIALPLAEVTDDIDGQQRSSTPDIGADEFVPPSIDAGVFSIASPTGPVFCPGPQPVQVTIRNYGASAISSAVLNWKVNGVQQTPFNWTGSLPVGGTSTPITVGTYSFTHGNYSVEAWTTLPAPVQDTVQTNDSASVSNINTLLSGIYTIGGATPHFATIGNAVSYAAAHGVCGPVTFNIRTGTYNEQVIIPEIPGASATNKITFQSETGHRDSVLIIFNTQPGNNYVVKLDGADHINFINMSFESVTPSLNGHGRVISMTNDATHNEFLGNKITAPPAMSNAEDMAVVVINEGTVSNTVNPYNKFVSNTISNGSIGIIARGVPSIPGIYIDGIEITGNTFINQFETAVKLNYLTSPKVSGNEINNAGNDGISCTQCKDSLRITSNKISNITGIAIKLDNCAGGTLRGLVANNFVHSYGSGSSYGFWLQNTSNQDIYSNSTNITANNSSGAALYLGTTSMINAVNNILSNTGGGVALYMTAQAGLNVSDHNNFYSTSGFIAYWNMSYYPSLSQWQTTTSKDLNSLSVLPLYSSTTDLHITSSQTLNNTGTPLALVTHDIDGQLRLSPPDIGADEFTNPPDDAGISSIDQPSSLTCPGLASISLRLKNYGAGMLYTADIHWEVNGIPQPNYSWADTLNASAVSPPVMLGSYNFSAPGTYVIKAYSSNPNGNGDTNNSNDTITVTLVLNFQALSLGPDQTICANDSAYLDAGPGYSSYLWSTGSTASSIYTSAPGIYSATVVTSAGCTFTDTVMIAVSGPCNVWPGDTDYDLSVDNSDFLAIGLHFGETGPQRSTTGNTWMPHPATDWSNAQANGMNVKHADCNGDGIVDNNDTLAVNLNYGLTHAYRLSMPSVTTGNPPLFFHTSQSSFNAGDWIDMEIWAGDSANPVSSLYGIAFAVDVNGTAVVPGTVSISYPNSWLGTPGSNALTLGIPFATGVDGAKVRNDHTNAAGFGKIAVLRFQADPNITMSSDLYTSFIGYTAVDSAGVPVLLSPEADTITVDPVITGIGEQNHAGGISAYPNPYTGHTNITYSLEDDAKVIIEVFDVTGRKVQDLVNKHQGKGRYTVQFSASVSGWSSGVYLVRMNIAGKISTLRIIEAAKN